jgi:hypothetical protein
MDLGGMGDGGWGMGDGGRGMGITEADSAVQPGPGRGTGGEGSAEACGGNTHDYGD